MNVHRIHQTIPILACCLAFVFAPGTRSQTPPDTISVLFVGNSYIYVNNLPALVEGISQGLDGPRIRTGIHTRGGARLWQHQDEGLLPRMLEVAKESGRQWDRVVFQEQSALASEIIDTVTGKLGDPVDFRDALRTLVPMVQKHGAVPLLYMTWAKQRYPDQTDDIQHAYDGMGQVLEIPVAPVGLAWARVIRERPDINLFLKDGSHPNVAGSYLAACVFYAMLTGISPSGAPNELLGEPWTYREVLESDVPTVLLSMDPDLASYLQQVAWDIVKSRNAE